MAIGFVQQSAAAIVGTTVTSITVTVPANVGLGNAVFVNVTSQIDGTLTLSFGTGMGINSASWTQASVQKAPNPDKAQAFTWFGLNSSGGSASVVVTSSVANVNLTGGAAEFSGVATSGALDASGTNSGNSTTATTISEGANGEVYVACETDSNGFPPSAGPTNGFTTLINDSTNQNFLTAYKLIAGADSTGWTLTSTVTWATATGTYKPATAADNILAAVYPSSSNWWNPSRRI